MGKNGRSLSAVFNFHKKVKEKDFRGGGGPFLCITPAPLSLSLPLLSLSPFPSHPNQKTKKIYISIAPPTQNFNAKPFYWSSIKPPVVFDNIGKKKPASFEFPPKNSDLLTPPNPPRTGDEGRGFGFGC